MNMPFYVLPYMAMHSQLPDQESSRAIEKPASRPLSKSHSLPHSMMRNARIVLRAAEGTTDIQIAQQWDIGRRSITRISSCRHQNEVEWRSPAGWSIDDTFEGGYQRLLHPEYCVRTEIGVVS